MGRKRLDTNKDKQENLAGTVSSAIESMFQHLQKTSGGMVCQAADIAEKSWGLPSDYISYRWLTDNVCFPMGRIIGIAGMKESCKSSYAATLARSFLELGGATLYVDTEKKISGPLYNTILGNDHGISSMYYNANTTEDWQEQVLECFGNISEHPEAEKIPVMVVVDSLGGVDTQETSDRIEKEGGINPRNTGGMIKCKSHNEFFRYVNKYLYMKPFNFVYINHLSDDPASPIQGAKRKPGGTGQDYHAVLDLWFSVVKSTPQEKVSRGFSEKMIKITVAKNSIGASKRNIEIPFRVAKADNGSLERVWFDWDAATAMLLSEDGPGSLKPKLKHILTVTCNANKYSCKELGLVAVTDTEMGAAIRNDAELRERISDTLGVNRMKVFPHFKGDKDVYEKYGYAAAPNTTETEEATA